MLISVPTGIDSMMSVVRQRWRKDMLTRVEVILAACRCEQRLSRTEGSREVVGCAGEEGVERVPVELVL